MSNNWDDDNVYCHYFAFSSKGLLALQNIQSMDFEYLDITWSYTQA